MKQGNSVALQDVTLVEIGKHMEELFGIDKENPLFKEENKMLLEPKYLIGLVDENFKKLEELSNKIEETKVLADKAKQDAEKAATFKVGFFNKGQAIENLQQATSSLTDALEKNIEANILTYEFQKQISQITRGLFLLGIRDVATNRIIVKKLEENLRSAAEKKLSQDVKAQIIDLIKQLKDKEDMIQKQENMKNILKEHESQLKDHIKVLNNVYCELFKQSDLNEKQEEKINMLADILQKESELNKHQQDILQIQVRMNEEQQEEIRKIQDLLLFETNFNREQQEKLNQLESILNKEMILNKHQQQILQLQVKMNEEQQEEIRKIQDLLLFETNFNREQQEKLNQLESKLNKEVELNKHQEQILQLQVRLNKEQEQELQNINIKLNSQYEQLYQMIENINKEKIKKIEDELINLKASIDSKAKESILIRINLIFLIITFVLSMYILIFR
ncbi:hypothetical protein [Caloramator sp. ALD01]|uniref:hypothetical protein n=1 Tax=Caloramator sp. ALD01 TaxID=1031288 RepID=UPI000402F797|nr:hypothetical protein [Caloramator sp. ALD01]